MTGLSATCSPEEKKGKPIRKALQFYFPSERTKPKEQQQALQ